MDISVLGLDLGKNSCSVVGLDVTGRVVVRRMPRDTAITFATKLPGCVVAMEACCGAHHMGRALAAQGHLVRLMSPEYVRPYVKAQKNDDRDPEAIAEASTRPTMRFVEFKPEQQLDLQTLHRVRDQLVGERTSLMNQIRSLLLERGHIVPQGRARLAARLADLLDGEESVLGARMDSSLAICASAGQHSMSGSQNSTQSSPMKRKPTRASGVDDDPRYRRAERHRARGCCR